MQSDKGSTRPPSGTGNRKAFIVGAVVLTLAVFVWFKSKSSSNSTSAGNATQPAFSPSDYTNATQAQIENAYNYDPTTGQWTGNAQADPYYSYFVPQPVIGSTSTGAPPNAADVNNALYGPGYLTTDSTGTYVNPYTQPVVPQIVRA